MKFYSELTKEIYDTEKQLQDAERKFVKETNKNDIRMAKAEKDAPVNKVPTKKQLAANVEKAEEAVNEAQANLRLANQKAQELSKKYLAEIDSIVEPAKKQLKDAQQARYDAIRKFNEAYGAYTTTYTGTRAADEFARAVADMQSFFPLFRF